MTRRIDSKITNWEYLSKNLIVKGGMQAFMVMVDIASIGHRANNYVSKEELPRRLRNCDILKEFLLRDTTYAALSRKHSLTAASVRRIIHQSAWNVFYRMDRVGLITKTYGEETASV